MWFMLAIVVVIGLLAIRWKTLVNPKTGEPNVGTLIYTLARYMILALLAAFALTFVQDAVVVVPAGHRGVVFDVVKGVKPAALQEGMNFIVPFMQQATLVDVRVQKKEFDASAASKDLQTVRAKVAVNIHPDAAKVPILFKEVGLSYAEKIVHPAVQEVMKASTARYTAEELITKREQVKQVIQDELRKVLTRSNIILLETYLTDFDFSSEFAKAIESKQVAEQQALKARRDLERVKIEAEQQIAKARAEAEALRMQRISITAQLIELRRIEMQKSAIEKWDGKMPDVMLGGGTPFFDVSRLIQDRVGGK
jgi:regulator of protease activity HflC (stomatin/prohibitin superfamily)